MARGTNGGKGKKGKDGTKKYGRYKIKALGRGSALALYVRNLIPAEKYFELTGQK